MRRGDAGFTLLEILAALVVLAALLLALRQGVAFGVAAADAQARLAAEREDLDAVARVWPVATYSHAVPAGESWSRDIVVAGDDEESRADMRR